MVDARGVVAPETVFCGESSLGCLPPKNGRLADKEPGRPAWDTSRCVGQEQPIAIIACGVMEESEDTG